MVSKFKLCINNENTVGMVCTAHILHNAIQHGSNGLNIDLGCIVFKLHDTFSMHTVRAEEHRNIVILYKLAISNFLATENPKNLYSPSQKNN